MKSVVFLSLSVMVGILLSVNVSYGTNMNTTTTDSIYHFTVKTIDEKDQSLAAYRGKVLLIVNTASRCGFTPQYKSLEAIYQEFKEQGFEVLGFPANDFMGQEPGDNSEIKKFCELKFKTTFPLFSKISVKGKDIAPLYEYLTTRSGFEGDITWNFNKFLVDRRGNVVARFGSKTDPKSPEIVDQIKKAIAS